jgi:hypothetical protein
LKVVRKSFGFIGALSWRTGAPLPSLPPANKDLTYDEIHIGDVVWFSEDKLRKNSGLIAKFQAVEGNDRPGDHPAIILDKRIDEVSGEESIRFQLCTSQKKRRYTHYQIEDESGVSYGRVLDLMPGSAHFPLPTFVEPKPNGDGTWTATSADFERYFTKTGTPLKIQLTPESVKRLQTCPEWRGRQSTPSTTN